MTKVMPQEIEVWYLIPSLRRELAKIFVKDYNLSQKEAAQILGLTEAAVSQYSKSKRAIELKFTKEEQALVKETAVKIMKEKDKVMEHMYNACTVLRGSKTICDLHRRYEKGIPAGCDICMEQVKT